jgi:DNA primase
VLYGLKQAKTAIRAAEEAVLVEGYADVVALHQAGVANVVAASGTALTAQQVKLLKSYARTVVLLYDADAAGQAAAARGIHVALDGGLGVYLLTLPAGADPDSFVRQFGAEAFANLLKEERQDFVAFLAESARRTGRLDTPEGKADAANEIVDAIARVGDPIVQAEYVRRAAAALGVYEADVRKRLDLRLRDRRAAPAAPPEARPADRHEMRPVPPPAPPTVVMRPEERDLLRLMLQHGAAMVEHVLGRMAIEEFSDGPVRQMAQTLRDQFEAGHVDAGVFTRGEGGEDLKRLAAEVTAEAHAISTRGAEKRGKEPERLDARPFDVATSAMRLLKLDRVEEALAALRLRLAAAEQAGEDATAFYAEVDALNELRRQIDRNAFLEWNAS